MYQGELVILRSIRRSDQKKIFEFFDDNQSRDFQMQGGYFPWTEQQVEAWMNNLQIQTPAYYFAVEDRETEKLIGLCMVEQLQTVTRVAQVAILIGDPLYRHKGYGAQALRVLLEFLFHQLNLSKVTIRAPKSQEGAVHACQNAGFKIEGTLRNEAFFNNYYSDVLYMGILAEEFNEKSAATL